MSSFSDWVPLPNVAVFVKIQFNKSSPKKMHQPYTSSGPGATLMKVCDSSRHTHAIFFVLFSQAAASLLFCAVLTFPRCASQLLALIIYSHPFLRLRPPPPPLVATNLCLFLSLHLYLSVDSPIFVIHWISVCIIAFYPVFCPTVAFSPCVHILVFMGIGCLQISQKTS